MGELQIMSMNCRGLGGQLKRRDVMHFIKQTSFDIVLLQDTHVTQRTIPFFDTIWKGKCFHSCGTSNSRGSAIMFKHSLSPEIICEKYCPDGNYVIVVCKIRRTIYTICSIYGPNEDRPAFYKSFDECLEQLPQENLFLGGDLNFVMDHTLDSNYTREHNVNAKASFLETVHKHCLIDTWRHFHPSERQYTWVKRNPLKYGRLDMLFASEHLLPYIRDTSIKAGYRTDHNIVSLTVNEPENTRGPSLYRFNESLLNDEAYISIIKQSITQVIKQYAIPIYSEDFIANPINYEQIQFTIDVGLFYETLLMMLRGETVKYSKRKARKSREQENRTIQEVNDLQEKFALSGLEDDANQLAIAQTNLEKLREPKIKGLITRSRVAFYEEGERCSKYFLSLEKRNAERKSIHSLKVNDRIISKKDEILKEFTNHLSQKYNISREMPDAASYLQDNITRSLNLEQKEKNGYADDS